MKITIKAKHTYFSGITTYDMNWKTDYYGLKNFTLRSVVVASKEPLSTTSFKKWSSALGVNVEALFTDLADYEDDIKKANIIIEAFNNEFEKVFDELNSHNKCEVRYTATLNPNYKPFNTAFETIQVYDVNVHVEYKSGYINAMFPSQGSKKNSACQRMVFDGKKLVSICEEAEAIDKIKSYIGQYIKDCDTDEKFNELSKKFAKVQKELKKYM
jgi:hypothetical protein